MNRVNRADMFEDVIAGRMKPRLSWRWNAARSSYAQRCRFTDGPRKIEASLNQHLRRLIEEKAWVW